MKSVTARIEEARDFSKPLLGISATELTKEIMAFYNNTDTEGMKKMFLAYLGWELKGWELGAYGGSKEDTIKRATENFDVLACIADYYSINKDPNPNLIKHELREGKCNGPITAFYRDLIQDIKV